MINLIQTHVFVLNTIAMALSLLFSIRFLVVTRFKVHAAHFSALAILSALYLVSYLHFLFGAWSRLFWSEVMVVPSVISIIILWIMPIFHALEASKKSGTIDASTKFIPDKITGVFAGLKKLVQKIKLPGG